MFFYFIPSSKNYFLNKEKNRKCVIFKIDKDIRSLLDLTTSIISNNDFNKNIITRDSNNKKWISYDPMKTMDYYKNGKIQTKFDKNFKCITVHDSNIKDRPYCDVSFYAGRRKLHEIFFKTRKYKYNKIYLKLDLDAILEPYEKYRLYHPTKVPISHTWDFDKYILDVLGINGFFFVDYTEAIHGGELLLIKPKNFIHKILFSNKACYSPDAFPNIHKNNNLSIE
jgi:hypothetical protein